MRDYIIKIEGKEYKQSGGFACGIVNAIKDCLKSNYPSYDLISPGVSYGCENGRELFKAVALDYDRQMGLIIWAFEL